MGCMCHAVKAILYVSSKISSMSYVNEYIFLVFDVYFPSTIYLQQNSRGALEVKRNRSKIFAHCTNWQIRVRSFDLPSASLPQSMWGTWKVFNVAELAIKITNNPAGRQRNLLTDQVVTSTGGRDLCSFESSVDTDRKQFHRFHSEWPRRQPLHSTTIPYPTQLQHQNTFHHQFILVMSSVIQEDSANI